MATEPIRPDALLQSLESLAVVEGVQVMEPWDWNERREVWQLHARVTRRAPSTSHVPANTDWIVLAEAIFPWGRLRFYPASTNSITSTFPHQNLNRPPEGGEGFRAGLVCLEPSVQLLGRHGGDNLEPLGQPERLAWRFERLKEWLRRAARGELLAPGDPFELPDYGSSGAVVAFSEDAETFARWQRADAPRSGTVEIGYKDGKSMWCFAKEFRDANGRLVLEASWGSRFSQIRTSVDGIWLRLDDVPRLRPWQAPLTMAELRRACTEQGHDLDALLVPNLRHIRRCKFPTVLVGFPIPKTVGEPPARMHWLALRIDGLSLRAPKGFRPLEDGFLRNDRAAVLADASPLQWQPSENWHQDQIATRGRFSAQLASKSILLIGAGALGSAVGELLVRGGVENITLVDGDTLEVGNLVRHMSDLEGIGKMKADDLASRLNSISPHAKVRAICKRFPAFDAEETRLASRCDLILDTTGEDDVLESISRYLWPSSRLFISVSLGRLARRLFCYARFGAGFGHENFRSAIAPWLNLESQERDIEGDDPIWSGIGCWHPVFPANADDVRMLATVAVKEIQRLSRNPPEADELSVWEQLNEDDEFAGIHRAALPAEPVRTSITNESDDQRQ